MLQIYVRYYSKISNYFVGNIFHKAFAVINANNLMGTIYNPYVNIATISIGKTAYPF